MRKLFILFIVALSAKTYAHVGQNTLETNPFALNQAMQTEYFASRSNNVAPVPHRYPGYHPNTRPQRHANPPPRGPGYHPRTPRTPSYEPRNRTGYPYGPHPRHHHWRPYPGPRRPLPGYGPLYPYCAYYPYSPRCYGYYHRPYAGVSVSGGPFQFWVGF